MNSEVINTLSEGLTPSVTNHAGGFGVNGWGNGSYIFSQTCQDEQILNSQYSLPSFNSLPSNLNNNPDTEACSDCNFKVEKCGARNCLLCKQLRKDHYFSSTVTGRKYHIRTTENLNCDSSNLIYLLTCNNCSLQYTGETVQVLKQRIRQHRSGTFSDNDGKVFYEHLSSGMCSGAGFSVQIIQKLVGDGRTTATIPSSQPQGRVT